VSGGPGGWESAAALRPVDRPLYPISLGPCQVTSRPTRGVTWRERVTDYRRRSLLPSPWFPVLSAGLTLYSHALRSVATAARADILSLSPPEAPSARRAQSVPKPPKSASWRGAAIHPEGTRGPRFKSGRPDCRTSGLPCPGAH